MNFKIISNPPYFRYKNNKFSNIENLSNFFKTSANIYMLVTYKCLDMIKDGDEINFLIPKDFIKQTSAIELNKRLFDEGGFLSWQEFGDDKFFDNACPNVIIFHWKKNAKHKIPIYFQNGFFSFEEKGHTKLSDIFDIKVGACTGNNDVFHNKNGNLLMAISASKKTGKAIRVHYGKSQIPYILKYKQELLKRQGSKFDEDNWWDYIRKPYIVSKKVILVLCRTRDSNPFFTVDCECWDGTLFGLIPKSDDIDIDEWIDKLNNIDWYKMGFGVGGRLIFSQRSLSNCYID